MNNKKLFCMILASALMIQTTTFGLVPQSLRHLGKRLGRVIIKGTYKMFTKPKNTRKSVFGNIDGLFKRQTEKPTFWDKITKLSTPKKGLLATAGILVMASISAVINKLFNQDGDNKEAMLEKAKKEAQLENKKRLEEADKKHQKYK